MAVTCERFLRPTGPGTWDVYLGGEVVGTVARDVWYEPGGTTDDHHVIYRGTTVGGNVPMPDGSVLSTEPRDSRRPASYEKRREPLHRTPEEAAKLVVLAVETGRILSDQIAYERAHGWSTD
jgi:hypothetical protein